MQESLERYDTIGRGYARRRRPDPRIEAAIHEALGDAETIVNVGAGTGSYEPRDRRLVAVEPSRVMLEQRPPDAAPAVSASALDLPFADDRFDAALAILTVHHWPDPLRGLAELRRVARQRVVVLTFDPTVGRNFWLMDYFPAIQALDESTMPAIQDVAASIAADHVVPIPIPHDCIDGFLGAYWRQPDRYLDATVRASMSVFPRIGDATRELERLRADLASGAWHRQYGPLLERDALDLGYRLVVA